MNQFGAIPAELRARRSWVVWKLVQREGEDKPTKPLYNPATLALARTHDTPGKVYHDKAEDTWGSFTDAITAYRRNKEPGGIGFVFTEHDPYVGIDLDGCLVNGKFTAEAAAIVRLLNSYTERSQSGKGVHIIVRGKLPEGGRRKGSVEMYDRARYFAMTGDIMPKCSGVIEDRQSELEELHRSIFGEKPVYATVQARPTPVEIDVLEKARKAKNGYKFAGLYDYGDVTPYEGDDSRADLALVGMLAFYTQGDESKIDSLFRGSALYRPKWDRADYRRKTIGKALSGKTEFYTPNGNSTAVQRIVNPETGEIIEPTTTRYRPTEFGDSERLVDTHADDLRYCTDTQRWFAWNGQRWVGDAYSRVIDRSKETVRAIGEDAMKLEDPEARQKWLKHAWGSEKASHVKNMEFLARSFKNVQVEMRQFDTDPYLLNCRNGTVNLRDGSLLDYKRVDMLTMMAGCEYHPDATAPTWNTFLNRILPDPDVRTFFQRACGYSLTGDTSEQCFFFLHGSGANGKSTAINALLTIMDEYGLQATSDLLLAQKSDRVRPDIAELNRKRLVATIEIDDGRRMAEGLVKQMTGGEDIRARFLYQGFFQFKPTHKVFMAANHKPIIRGTDLAIWRRVMLIPFTETIPDEEKDPKLGHKLRTEASGILRWCVEGSMEWQERGLQPPHAVLAAVTQYREEQDIVGRFIVDRCKEDPFASVQAGRLYRCYVDWAHSNGEKEMSSIQFGRELTSKGFVSDKPGGVQHRIGLDVKGESLEFD